VAAPAGERGLPEDPVSALHPLLWCAIGMVIAAPTCLLLGSAWEHLRTGGLVDMAEELDRQRRRNVLLARRQRSPADHLSEEDGPASADDLLVCDGE
jgi:hypothetical protein